MKQQKTVQKPVSLQVYLDPDLHKNLKKAVQKDGKTVSEFARRALSVALEQGQEQPFEARLDKVLKRIDGLTAVVKSIEDDEIERRRLERKNYQEVSAQNMAQVGEVIAANSLALQELAARQDALKTNVEAELEVAQNRLQILLKLCVSLVRGTDERGVRESYREIERGMTDGKKLVDFQMDALKRS